MRPAFVIRVTGQWKPAWTCELAPQHSPLAWKAIASTVLSELRRMPQHSGVTHTDELLLEFESLELHPAMDAYRLTLALRLL